MEKHGRSELDADSATQVKTEVCEEKLLLPVFPLALIKAERETQFMQTLLVSPCMHNHTPDTWVKKHLTTKRTRVRSAFKHELHPTPSEWLLMRREWMVVKHAQSQMRHHQCTAHQSQDLPQLRLCKKYLRKETSSDDRDFKPEHKLCYGKKTTVNGKWRDVVIGFTLNPTLTINRLHAAVPFRLCRTKQNPDSSPPSRVEWIQYNTEGQIVHLAMTLQAYETNLHHTN